MRKITSRFPGLKVLIVEDYFINQEVTKDMLELMDCDVEVIDNGKDALSLMTKNPYDLVLMDLQIPEIDGYDVTRLLRKHENGEKHTLIVALTASALSGDRQKCLEAGMDDYLSKPLEIEKLEETLRKYFPTKLVKAGQ